MTSMKRTLPLVVPIALLVSAAAFVPSVFATVPPTLTLSATNSGDNVQVTVTGDPSSSVLLSYIEAGYGPTITSLGSTDVNGNFTTVISSAGYNLTAGTLVTAIIGSTSGPKSPTIAWPVVSAAANSLSLSQNAVVVNAGSSVTLAASNLGSGALYVANNSNSSIANVGISGSQVTISGNISGSTTVTLCPVGNTVSCPTVYVTVEPAGAGQLPFSQSSVSVVSGQNLPITMSGGNGVYQILNNSNASVIQASISGSVLTVSTGASSGSSSITVCTSDMALCGVVVATAGSAGSVATTFSNSAPVISLNQSTTVNIYGPSGVQFYVSSNSSPAIVQANLSGTTLTLTGIAAGSSSISVCSTTGTCTSLTVTVQDISTGANIALSQNTVSVLSGQNIGITVSGGEQPYTIVGGTSSISQETLSGNTLTVYGISSGTSSVNVCSSGGGCVPLTVTVNGTGTTVVTPFSMSQTSLSLAIGGSAVVTLYGSGSYYLSSNAGPSVAVVAVSGSTATVAGLSSGSTNAVICESGGSCSTLSVTVSGTQPQTTVVSSPAATPAYTFTQYLAPGAAGADVTALQNLLVSEGYLSATPTGYYGSLTVNAVTKFQAAHGIEQLGVVGPATRAALNTIENANASSGSSAVTSTSIASMSLSQLQAEVQSLESQLTQVLNRIAQLTGQ